MKIKKVTLAGREVSLAYCYATEIAFKSYTGEDMGSFIAGLAKSQAQAADPQKTLYTILSAVTAYDQGTNAKERQITDEEIMYQASPQEIIGAFTEVMKLRSEWYKIPSGEPEEKKQDEGEGSKKN